MALTETSETDVAFVDVDVDDEDETSEVKRRRELESRLKQRHYKKDSRFLLDLYTLTFDEDQTVDEIETCKTRIVSTDGNEIVRRMSTSSTDDAKNDVADVEMPKVPTARSMSMFERGPKSLGFLMPPSQNVVKSTRSGSIPSLETNLLKILARKIQDSEDISFRKAKLLTKAYYRMLRNNSDFLQNNYAGTSQPQEYSSLVVTSATPLPRLQPQPKSFPPTMNRLSWQNLVRSSNEDLRRMVGGLENSAKVLNDYLVDLLLEKDDLLQDQDEMLEEISEIADLLLA